jgi:hypothetical protein
MDDPRMGLRPRVHIPKSAVRKGMVNGFRMWASVSWYPSTLRLAVV